MEFFTIRANVRISKLAMNVHKTNPPLAIIMIFVKNQSFGFDRGVTEKVSEVAHPPSMSKI